MAITTADKVADYILYYANKHEEPITNKKLQKLVYYAQAWYLALYDNPLFDDRIEAWIFGPVQPDLYRKYKFSGWEPIRKEIEKRPDLQDDVIEHVNEVLEVFMRYDAWQLERMTHNEDPWIKAREGLLPDEPSTNEITHDNMRIFYRNLSDEKKEN